MLIVVLFKQHKFVLLLPVTGRKLGVAASVTAAPPAPAAPEGALQLGQFTMDPAEAVIKPGCKQQVSVVFRAEGNCNWASVAALDISERDPTDHPSGIPYELGGESCIPGGVFVAGMCAAALVDQR